MPLTLAYVEQSNPMLWLATKLDLGIVALGSAGLLAATLTLQPKQPRPAYLLALLGLLPFSFQTIILDAIAWPAYF